MEIESWGRRIRAFRKLKGFTQKELADELGVSVSVLGEIERGTRFPTKDILMSISNVLNVNIEELKPEDDEIFN